MAEFTAADIASLASRIQDLEIQLVRNPIGRVADGDTNGCTNCNTNGCTNCAGDRFQNVLLPGEEVRLSGGELVARLRASRKQ